MHNSALLVNAAVAIAFLVCYTIITISDHDGSTLLALLGGQGIATLLAKGVDVARNTGVSNG